MLNRHAEMGVGLVGISNPNGLFKLFTLSPAYCTQVRRFQFGSSFDG